MSANPQCGDAVSEPPPQGTRGQALRVRLKPAAPLPRRLRHGGAEASPKRNGETEPSTRSLR